MSISDDIDRYREEVLSNQLLRIFEKPSDRELEYLLGVLASAKKYNLKNYKDLFNFFLKNLISVQQKIEDPNFYENSDFKILVESSDTSSEENSKNLKLAFFYTNILKTIHNEQYFFTAMLEDTEEDLTNDTRDFINQSENKKYKK